MAGVTTSSRSDFPGAAIAGPLSIRQVSALLERLPAGERAAFSWAPSALEHEIQPLRQGPLTTDVVVSCTAAVFRVFAALIPSLVKAFGAARFFSEVDGAYSDVLDKLRRSPAGCRRQALC